MNIQVILNSQYVIFIFFYENYHVLSKKKIFTFFGIPLGIHWLQEKNVYNKNKKICYNNIKVVTIIDAICYNKISLWNFCYNRLQK